MALLSLVGLCISAYLTLVKFGVIGTLACGLSGGCNVVQSSQWAIFLRIPVPVIGLGGYALLLVLAIAGTHKRFASSRLLSVSLSSSATLGFLFSMYLTALEAFMIHAWCRWCVASAILATTIFLLSIPEVAYRRRR